ncbi:MFS transporter [Clostridium carboxidivorans P7]|uniref:Major facilitator superfamily MFS_1 n=1 Tax=Clostridium carboxidivorans P7 TaxID=536227 RepID=C6PYJ2_9CLOT|nr:oxalate/formate MFS antiporter [Clostridium carboxidivorans]AKN29678.1 MFS transporter [Clostridium carboxidivorans P7]EET85672.1 major facilitator superfamily MFS_1 [Clostridium carboxidivorans P7]EFG89387.1 transporter, major facilitator family protein [Clostridium carboxidivorans P7]
MSDIDDMKIKNLNAYGPFCGNRWVQLISACLAMVMIANLQYAWTLFTTPLVKSLHSSLVAVQYAFTLFIMFETFVQPVGGLLLDKFGTKLMFALAGVLIGGGWAMLGQATSVTALYFFYAAAGVGAAIIYGGSVSVAVRWFPDKRGLASGLIAGAFGIGSMPFVPVISKILKASGVAQAFGYTGILQGVIVVIIAFILRYPVGSKMPSQKEKAAKADPAKIGFSPSEVLKTPHFWLIWTMFFSISVGGLIVTANTKPFGTKLGIASSVIIAAVMMNSLANGIGRVFWGTVSDKLGRARTMFISFGLNAIFLFLLPMFGGKSGAAYVILLMCVMFTWGQLFSLFPSINADMFGSTYAATNYGFIYSGKGFASILGGGLGAALAAHYSWNVVFTVAALFSLYASLMSLVLPRIPKPVRRQNTIDNSKPTIPQ